MESEATAAAFQAMALTELNKNFYETLPDTSPRQWQADISPPRDARAETLGLCGRMLGEAAALASPLGLPPRATPPPSTPNLEWLAGGEDTAGAKEMRHTRATEPLASAVAERFLPGFGKPVRTDPLAVRLRDYQKPYWQFRMKPGEVFRIGSLCLEVLTREAAGTRGRDLYRAPRDSPAADQARRHAVAARRIWRAAPADATDGAGQRAGRS
jgi:hypothetical protein